MSLMMARIGVEAARRVHAQHHELRALLRGLLEAAMDVVGARGPDRPVDREHNDRGRRREEGSGPKEQHQE